MAEEFIPSVNILSVTESDPTMFRAAYTADLGETGKVRIHCADLVLVGSTGSDDGPENVSIVVGQQSCGCGCPAIGRAFEYVPTTEQARNLAVQLIAAADEVDALAKERAKAALAKAAGK